MMAQSSEQLELFPVCLHLQRIDPAHNMRRFYAMHIQPDLFGGASLVREWGRIGCGGRILAERHADEGRAVSSLLKLAAVKCRRGYGL